MLWETVGSGSAIPLALFFQQERQLESELSGLGVDPLNPQLRVVSLVVPSTSWLHPSLDPAGIILGCG